ncbi:unnamed protein product [Cuscuta epithymum]|uniref:Uncharacterized protein n=1 Tax=Cuscuta epithymum TaxID=186058 RepID=A0AAV0G7X4_9ASTE|nr:unnamed protein product [Cuscuta epithymum]
MVLIIVSASVSGLSGLDWNWEANPIVLECSECNSDVKEQEVEVENVPFFSSMDEWERKEVRKEHTALGDHSWFNFFGMKGRLCQWVEGLLIWITLSFLMRYYIASCT